MSRNRTCSIESPERKKLRAEIKALEKLVSPAEPGRRKKPTPEQDAAWSLLAYKWNQFQTGGKISSKRESYRLNREDATLRGSWRSASPLDQPASTDWSDPDRDTGGIEETEDGMESGAGGADAADGRRGSGSTGLIGEAPERQGPRFNTPSFVRNHEHFSRYSERLFTKRKKEYPTLVEFQRSKSGVDSQILWAYFMDHASYEEVFDEFGCVAENDSYGVYDISVQDADSIETAVEFAAQKSGTFSLFDPWSKRYTILDTVNHRFRKVTARKINHKHFRVDFRVQNEDNKYYLPKKLDPSKNGYTRPLQRYIEALVLEGHALMRTAKPNKAERKAASENRKAEEEVDIARNQYGAGTSQRQWEHTSTLDDQSMSWTQETHEHVAHIQIVRLENDMRAQDNKVQGLTLAEMWELKQKRGERAFEALMELAQGRGRRNLSNPPASQRRWLPRGAEPVPEAQPAPVPASVLAQVPALVIQHEVVRMSLQVLLMAALAQTSHKVQLPCLRGGHSR